MKDRYEKIKRFALELNRYARRKGVALQFSSCSSGVDYCGWGVPYSQPWGINRESYPDGAVYACVGGTCGACLSNEALARMIARPAAIGARRGAGLNLLAQPRPGPLCGIGRGVEGPLPAMPRAIPRRRAVFLRAATAGAAAGLYNRIVAELNEVKCRKAATMLPATWRSSSPRQATPTGRKATPTGKRT